MFPIYLATVFALFSTQSGVLVVAGVLAHPCAVLYGSASRISLLLLLPLSIVNLSVSPSIARSIDLPNRNRIEAQIRLLTTGASLIAMVGYALIAILFPLLSHALLPSNYEWMYPLTLVLALGPLTTTLTGPIGLALIMTDHASVTAKVSGMMCAIQLAGMIVACHLTGLYGVATVGCITPLFQNLILTIYARRILRIWTPTLFSHRSLNDMWSRAT